MAKRRWNIRNEEMPVIGKFLYDSFDRDFSDFQAYSPDFNTAYKNNFENKVNDVDEVVNPKRLLSELKLITDNLYELIDSLRPDMTTIEGYVNRATGLTILPGDFGFSAVRDKIGNKDQEALLENLNILLQNLDANMPQLTAKGYSTSQHNDLVQKREDIKQLNTDQNNKLDEKEALTQDNQELMNELWDMMSDVMDTGKRLYKYDNKEKTGDYTLNTIKQRIRHDHPRRETGEPETPPEEPTA